MRLRLGAQPTAYNTKRRTGRRIRAKNRRSTDARCSTDVVPSLHVHSYESLPTLSSLDSPPCNTTSYPCCGATTQPVTLGRTCLFIFNCLVIRRVVQVAQDGVWNTRSSALAGIKVGRLTSFLLTGSPQGDKTLRRLEHTSWRGPAYCNAPDNCVVH